MLSKQSIRGNVKILMNKVLVKDKEVLIKESETWTEPQVNFFRKMLKQGGYKLRLWHSGNSQI